ncbi:MAG TPA: CAP domain-containing protein [Pseudonocardiaceae bacterium]|nr:CAP domain-containing protein [Pseudonocardiaceae bacterium]
MSGSRRDNASVRVTLVAALLGAVTVGGTAFATALSPGGGALADTADFEPAGLVVTTTAPAGDHEALSGTIDHSNARSHRSTPRPTSTTTTAPSTTTTARPPATSTTARTTTTPATTQQDQVFTLVNQARAQAGCAALKNDPRLTQAAQGHSDDMSANHYFDHTTPSGVTFDAREKAAGYPTPGGENIAEGQTSAQQVMTDWMNSSGHRANILNCQFTAIGIGLNTNGWYWTQDFGY